MQSRAPQRAADRSWNTLFDSAPAIMDLKTMKRRELQKLCKAHSIKANMKNTEMIQALQERRREMLEEKKTMIEDEAVMKTREQDSDIMESAAAEKVTKEVIEEGTMGEEQNELAEPEGAELTLNSTYTIEPSTESSSTPRWALDYGSAVKDSPLLRNSHLLHARKDSPLLLARLAEKENTSPHNALRQVDKEQEPADYCTRKIPIHKHDALKNERITYEVEHREGSCVTCRLPDKSKLFRVSV